jgi:septal ring-binding cell division protein DamX
VKLLRTLFCIFFQITANVTLQVNGVDTTTSSILTDLQNRVQNITATLQNCVRAKFDFSFNAFAQVKANYTACKAATTTAAPTTEAATTVAPTDATTTTVTVPTAAPADTTTTVGAGGK